MTTTKSSKKKPSRKKTKVKRRTTGGNNNILHILLLLLMSGVLVTSVAVVCYVIFFQTALAQDFSTPEDGGIVYEEPDPPVHTEEIDEKNPHEVRQPKVALIIDDLGYDDVQARRLLSAPFELNYSFLPFAPHTRKLEAFANRIGKTVMLHLPLEPRNYAWEPGPGTIYLSDSPDVRKEKFIRCLGEVPHANGVNNHMGSGFTEDVAAMTEILQLIKARDLFFVDSFTTSKSTGFRVAEDLKMRSDKRQVFLDNERDPVKICRQLDKLVVIAEKRGKAIGIGHPHKETVDALEKCIPTYNGRVEFVSVLDLL